MSRIVIVLITIPSFLIALVVTLLFVPFRLYAGYKNDDFYAKAAFLIFYYRLYPFKEKKKKKKKPTVEPAEKKPKSEKRKFALSDISEFKELLKKHLPSLLSCLVFNKINLLWHINASDAAKTAIEYGAASSLISGCLAITDRFTKVKRAEIDIFPDFDGDKKILVLDIIMSTTLFKLLRFFLKALPDLKKHGFL